MAVKRSPHGFTLIELIVVVLLISLSTALVIGVNFRQSDSVRLNAAARELQAFLQLARSRAIFLKQNNRCFYQSSSRQISADLASHPFVLPQSVELIVNTVEGGGMNDTEAKQPFLLYYADGSAAGPKISLVNAGKRIAVTIDPLLGFVSMEPASLKDGAGSEQ
ncbi:prepilin-type N-terminal cleavage/methylation domain-containing protein [uncultured Desulfuromonas sp.]|uniref:prepilin-type N-terminal cleavage/methylation domain-containing protein n=1 Tax=uncultured Desulfuromonas sp. TaxID=181013 RepID=UPI002AAAB6BF|nr:prepilin-type N-terminal cleavage/methylation domain-containing protein [uncultured Desulfuromonas sp.]